MPTSGREGAMSDMEPDEGATPEDERDTDAPRWDKAAAASGTDAPRWDKADADDDDS
jgi:hypothetical protein